MRQNLVKFIPTKWNPGYTTAELPAAIYATDFVMKQAERVLPKRHLSGKSWYSALSELTTSASVSLSVSCTVHVSGAGPDVYPLTCLQSVSSLAVGGCLANNIRKIIQHVAVVRNLVNALRQLLPPRSEIDSIARGVVVVRSSSGRYDKHCGERARNTVLRIRQEAIRQGIGTLMLWHRRVAV